MGSGDTLVILAVLQKGEMPNGEHFHLENPGRAGAGKPSLEVGDLKESAPALSNLQPPPPTTSSQSSEGQERKKL